MTSEFSAKQWRQQLDALCLSQIGQANVEEGQAGEWEERGTQEQKEEEAVAVTEEAAAAHRADSAQTMTSAAAATTAAKTVTTLMTAEKKAIEKTPSRHAMKQGETNCDEHAAHHQSVVDASSTRWRDLTGDTVGDDDGALDAFEASMPRLLSMESSVIIM